MTDIIVGLLAVAVGSWQYLPNLCHRYGFDPGYEIQTCTHTCTNPWPWPAQVCKPVTIPSHNFTFSITIDDWLWKPILTKETSCQQDSTIHHFWRQEPHFANEEKPLLKLVHCWNLGDENLSPPFLGWETHCLLFSGWEPLYHHYWCVVSHGGQSLTVIVLSLPLSLLLSLPAAIVCLLKAKVWLVLLFLLLSPLLEKWAMSNDGVFGEGER